MSVGRKSFQYVKIMLPLFRAMVRYRIRMVKVSGTVVPGASLLLLQFVDECEKDILLTLHLRF